MNLMLQKDIGMWWKTKGIKSKEVYDLVQYMMLREYETD